MQSFLHKITKKLFSASTKKQLSILGSGLQNPPWELLVVISFSVYNILKQMTLVPTLRLPLVPAKEKVQRYSNPA